MDEKSIIVGFLRPNNLGSSTVDGEDDLATISLSIQPTLSTGTVKLEASSGGSKVKVWESATRGAEVALAKTWDIANESLPSTLYVEGYAASGSERDVELRLSWTSGAIIYDDKVKGTIVEVNLTELTVSEQDEEHPGAFICINDDDDNGDGPPDYSDDMTDTRLTAEGDDVRQLQIVLTPPSLINEGQFELYFGYARFNIYEKKDNAWRKYSNDGDTPIAADLNASYYYEGKATTDGWISAEFTLNNASTPLCEDKVKITVVKIDLNIYKTDKTTRIPDQDELAVGLFLAENDDDDGAPAGEDNGNTEIDTDADKNDMAKLELKKLLPSDLPGGTVELSATGNGSVRLFTTTPAGNHIPLPADNLWGNLRIADINYLLEGVTPGEVILTLKYTYGTSGCKDEVKITVYAMESVVWEEIDSSIDDNPNAGGGKRIIAGKLYVGDPSDRRKVKVKAKVTPVLENLTVYLRSFDVDDPFPNSDPNEYIDDETQSQDNRGSPKEGTLNASSAPTDTNGYAEVEFTVTLRPGDNFRVVASVSQGHLEGLIARQSDTTGKVVDSNNTEIPEGGPRGALAAPMLTVWRRLHIEVDSMQADTNNTNKLTGTIDAATYDPQTDTTDLTVDDVPSDFEKDDHFVNGFIVIAGESSAWPVVDFVKSAWDDDVFVSGDKTNAVGKGYTLVDDDHDGSNVNLPMKITYPRDPDTSLVEEEFARAYLRAVLDTTTSSSIPFNRNLSGDTELTEVINTDFQIKGYISDLYFGVHLISAHQPDRDEDQDPEADLPKWGSTMVSSHGCIIYLETCREVGAARVLWERETVTHELGHATGGEHGDGGLMGDDNGGLRIVVFQIYHSTK